MEELYRCSMCLEICSIEEEEFSYSPTHCNHGQDGVHKTGHYVSDCCGVEYIESEEDDDE